MKKKIFFLFVLVLIAAVIALSLHNVGWRISMLTIFVSLMGLEAKENGEFNQYKNLRSKYNPLYEQGCFRKKRSAVFNLKNRRRKFPADAL